MTGAIEYDYAAWAMGWWALSGALRTGQCVVRIPDFAATCPPTIVRLVRVQGRHKTLQDTDSASALATQLLAKIEELAASVERLQIRPALVVGKRAHLRDLNEATALPVLWRSKCGWYYGAALLSESGIRGIRDFLCSVRLIA